MTILKKKKLLVWLSLLALFSGIAAAAYSFTGPNRSVTTTYTTNDRQVCYWEAQHPDLPSGPRCYLKLYRAPSESCPSLNPISDQGYFSASACASAWSGRSCPASGGRLCSIGWQNNWVESCTVGQLGCTSVQHSQTTTYPPATVSGIPSCSVNGKNGWCIGIGQLNLSASEPLSGYSITGIEGSIGSLCASSSCSWTFPLGDTTLNYWALSSYGDTSAQATSSMRIDTTLPSISIGSPIGALGNNGWYISDVVSIAASATDLISGIAGIWSSLDGGSWQSGGNASVTGDADHTIEFRTEDIAGNEANKKTSIRLDSQSPELMISVPKPEGANGWYNALVNLTSSATDKTSGVESVGLSTDGANWKDSLTIGDGIIEVQGRAVDKAGNETLESKILRVDSISPSIDLSVDGKLGTNDWFCTPINLSIFASDETSGIDKTEMSLDNGNLQEVAPLLIQDGIHTLQIQASDLAGNQSGRTQIFQVDSLPPQSTFTNPPEGSSSVVSGLLTFQGESVDTTSGVGGVEISLNEGRTWASLPFDNAGSWFYSWNTSSVPNGTYPIWVRSIDFAGNEEQTAKVAVVVNNNPPIVDIPDEWKVWETVPVTIRSTSLPVVGARLIISGLQILHPERIISYGSSNLPLSIVWDQLLGDGVLAQPGIYRVVLEAWDDFGNRGQDEGIILVPQSQRKITTQTPTAITFVTRTPTPLSTPTPTLTPTREELIVAIVSPNPTSTTPTPNAMVISTQEKIFTPIQNKPVMFWPAVGLIGLLAALASASLSDTRPKALRKLRKILDIIQKNNSQIN